MNVVHVLEERAGELADPPAIIQTRRGRDQAISFRFLQHDAAMLDAVLRARGVRPGDRVALFLPLSIRLYVALIAVFRSGAVAVVCDPSLGLGRLRACIDQAKPAAVIASPAAAVVCRLLPETRRAAILSAAASGHASAPPDPVPVAADHPALLTFTSGSTGTPKPIVRSHALLIAQNEALAAVLRQQPGQVSLATLPIFVLANLAAGVTSVLADADLRRPGFVRPEPLLAQIQRTRPDSTVASPALLRRLADAVAHRGPEAHRFASIFTGGAPVFPDMLDRIAPLTSTGRACIVYGSSEAEPISHLDGLSTPDRERSASGGGLPVGRATPHTQVRIIRDNGGRPIGPVDAASFDAMCLPHGEPGEVIVSGAHVVPGNGHSEAKILIGSTTWHRTGDTGYLDASEGGGGLWLLGRCTAASRSEDRPDLYPFAVEAAVRACVPHQTALLAAEGGPVLLVEARRGLSPAQRSAVEKAIAPFGTIQIRPVKRIPLDGRHNAKVDYTRLARLSGSLSGS